MENAKSRVPSNRSRFLRFLPIIAAFPIITGLAACSIEEPQAPNWDVEVVIPLVNHRYGMLEIVDRISEDALSYDSTGYISFTIDEKIDTQAVDAGLTLDDLTSLFSEKLGLLEISSPPAVSAQVLLSDHIGHSGEIPPLTLESGESFPPLDNIRLAVISSGSLIVTISNYFGLPLDTVIVDIIDDTLSRPVGRITFPGGLAIDESKTGSIDLAGKTISNTFSFAAHLHSPGGTLDYLEGKYLRVEAGFSSTVSASSALARIPAQVKSFDQNVYFPGDQQVTSASISEGGFTATVTNHTGLLSRITLVVDELTRGGTPLSFQLEIPPHQVRTVTRSLDDYLLIPLSGLPEPTLNIAMEMNLPGSDTAYVQISASDSFEVDLHVSSLEFSSMTGIIEPTPIEIDPFTAEFEIPDGFENISLTNAYLTIDLVSAVNFPAQLDARLEVEGGRYVDISGGILPGTLAQPGLSIITAYYLDPVLDPIPQNIMITGTVTVGDGLTAGGVTENDFVCGTLRITSPLEMTIGETEINGDINRAEIESEDWDGITDRMLEATIHNHLTNHLPLALSLTLYLGADSLTLYTDPELVIGPLEVRPGALNIDGLVTGSASSYNTFTLTHEELQILDHQQLYIGQTLSFAGTGGETIKFICIDFIDLEAYMTVTVRIGER